MRRACAACLLALLLASCRNAPPASSDDAADPEANAAVSSPPLAPILFRSEDPEPRRPVPSPPTPENPVTQPAVRTSAREAPPAVEPAAADPRPATLRALIEELRAQRAGRPDDSTLSGRLAVLEILAGNYEEADRLLRRVDLNHDDFLRLLSAALANHLGETEAALEKLEATRNRWRAANQLRLTELHFCDIVYGYGNYRTSPDNSFLPGQYVAVYAEAKNYTCQKQKDDSFQVHITVDFEIRDGEGTTVPWRERNEHRRDLMRQGKTYLDEVYLPLRLLLPSNIPRGEYSLRIMIHDDLGDKNAEGSLDFRIR